MSRTIILKRDAQVNEEWSKLLCKDFIIKTWKPGITCFCPPGKSLKYLFYWVFHYVGLFGSKDYSAILIYKSNNIIASTVIVPACFKWPFMGVNDLQLTYVMTTPAYRGEGIAEAMLRFIIHKFRSGNRTFWYVTDIDNISSVKLSSKVGFEFFAYGKANRIFKILYPYY